ncbi:MAG: NAD-binding protein [Propionibacteriales bacterium]|nr:NAD-binding protein [Propionibacteriales bacterium]
MSPSVPADRVAVVGLGRMGAAMARRLSGAGRPLVVFNRTAARAAEVAEPTGAAVAGSPGEAAAGADVVLVSLADDAAVEATYGGPDGLAAGLRSGGVVLETSTVAPATVRAQAPLVEQRSATLLDAPVSGSVPLVESGQLTFMVGGDEDALDRVRPVLDILAGRVFHLGELGNGATMKLAVNSALHGLNQALSEALVLAEKAGLDRRQAYDVFAASALGAPWVQYKREAFERPEDAGVAFMLDLVAKDLELVDALARSVGARMEQLAANRRLVREAVDSGYGQRDMSALAVLLR